MILIKKSGIVFQSIGGPDMERLEELLSISDEKKKYILEQLGKLELIESIIGTIGDEFKDISPELIAYFTISSEDKSMYLSTKDKMREKIIPKLKDIFEKQRAFLGAIGDIDEDFSLYTGEPETEEDIIIRNMKCNLQIPPEKIRTLEYVVYYISILLMIDSIDEFTSYIIFTPILLKEKIKQLSRNIYDSIPYSQLQNVLDIPTDPIYRNFIFVARHFFTQSANCKLCFQHYIQESRETILQTINRYCSIEEFPVIDKYTESLFTELRKLFPESIGI